MEQKQQAVAADEQRQQNVQTGDERQQRQQQEQEQVQHAADGEPGQPGQALHAKALDLGDLAVQQGKQQQQQQQGQQQALPCTVSGCSSQALVADAQLHAMDLVDLQGTHQEPQQGQQQALPGHSGQALLAEAQSQVSLDLAGLAPQQGKQQRQQQQQEGQQWALRCPASGCSKQALLADASQALDLVGLSPQQGKQQQQQQPFDLRVLLFPSMASFLAALGTEGRAAWRCVDRCARDEVYSAARTLRWVGLPRSATPRTLPWDSNRTQPSSVPAQLLAKCSSLTGLVLHGMYSLNSLAGLPASLQSLQLADCPGVTEFSPLRHCTALQRLQLQGHLSRKGPHATSPATDLLPTLQALTRLRSLSLADLWKDSRSFAHDLASSISQLSALQHLHLEGRWDGQPTLAQLPCSFLEQLTHLSVTRSRRLPCRVGDVSRALQLTSRVKLLELRGLTSWTYYLPRLISHLSFLETLETLVFSEHYTLGSAGATALASVLGTLGNVTYLDLSCNGFGRTAVQTLCPCLTALPRLRVLCLRGNPLQLGDDGSVRRLQQQLLSRGVKLDICVDSPAVHTWQGLLCLQGTPLGRGDNVP